MDLPVLKYKHVTGLPLVKYRINDKEAENGWFHITSRKGGNLAFKIDIETGKMILSKTEQDFGEYKFHCAAQFFDGLWTGKRRVRVTIPPVFSDIILDPFKTNTIDLSEFHGLEIAPMTGWNIVDRTGKQLSSTESLYIDASTNMSQVLLLTSKHVRNPVRMQMKYKANKRRLMVVVNTYRALIENKTPFAMKVLKARPKSLPIKAIRDSYIIFKRLA
tara:strand:+ start:294 stop:947 length:654 start_codon:yes stop_codon:yes gene_type:complete